MKRLLLASTTVAALALPLRMKTRLLIGIAAMAMTISSPAWACTAEQHKYLQDQINETEDAITRYDNLPMSARPFDYTHLYPKLRGLYHAMQVCEDSYWQQN
jgi:hypothetical protein